MSARTHAVDWVRSLATLSPAQARLGNRLYAAVPAVSPNGAGSLSWQHDPSLHDAGFAFVLELRDRQGNDCTLGINNPLLLDEMLQGPNRHLDNQTLGFVAQSHCAELLDALERSLGVAVDVVAAHCTAQPPDLSAHAQWRFDFQWHEGHGHKVYGGLCAKEDFWRQACIPSAEPRSLQTLSPLGFDFSLLLGETTLAVGDLEKLEPGGWLIIERHSTGSDSRFRLRAQGRSVGLCFNARVGNKGELFMTDQLREYTLPDTAALAGLAGVDPSSAPPAATVGSASSASADNLAGGLQVRLSFEVGSLRIDLQELASVKAGHVFDLGKPIEQHMVGVLLDGQEIAAGRLVKVGDSLGVRLEKVRPLFGY